MSSKNTSNVNSIANRLYRDKAIGKIFGYIRFDLFCAILIIAGYLLALELMKAGCFTWNNYRWFGTDHGWKNIYYYVQTQAGERILELPLRECESYGRRFLCFLGAFFALQLFGLLISYNGDYHRIRRALKPINDLALQADELSKMSFDENKYHRMEEAISKMNPEDNKPLTFGDESLSGIEAAMNNLLIRMRQSYEQQARFVNDASHELRTPIAVIEGYANMLSRWGKEDEAVLDESITAITKESAHMKYLVEQLLFLARGDSGKTQLNLETVSLNELMQDIYEESIMIDENHIYRYKVGGMDKDVNVEIKADKALLKQAVRILVDNSAKYTKEKEEILLEVGINEQHLPYLQVQDTGIGMEEADVEHMFERFYRADESRSYKGTGLGLSIAKWIIDKHHGHFEVLSRTELGTRIRIVLGGDLL